MDGKLFLICDWERGGQPDALSSLLLHRALGYCGFWYPQGSWKQSPIDTSDAWGVTRHTQIFDSAGLGTPTPTLFKGQLWTLSS